MCSSTVNLAGPKTQVRHQKGPSGGQTLQKVLQKLRCSCFCCSMKVLSSFHHSEKSSVQPEDTLDRTGVGADSHAEEDIVLGTDAQALPDGAQLRPDVSPEDEGGAGGWREETGQNGPASRGH